MKKTQTFTKIVASAAIAFATLTAGMGNAWAIWTQITDPDTGDAWTNPGDPSNENPATIAAYLQHLLGLANAPTLVGSANSYGGAPLSGFVDPVAGDALYLSLHFGNGNDYPLWPHNSNFDVFFSCESSCETFTSPSTNSISNYRFYEGPGGQVTTQAAPEPLTLSLIGIGLAGLGVSRRRARR
jgi:hypothetical protein